MRSCMLCVYGPCEEWVGSNACHMAAAVHVVDAAVRVLQETAEKGGLV